MVAGGGGDDDGLGQAEEPGGAVDGVVGGGTAHDLDGAVSFSGEEEGELVGFGPAGGDQGVRVGPDLGGECCGDEGFEGGGGRGLVPGVHRRVEGAGGEVGGGREGERRGVQVGGAVWFGGVGGAFGEGADEGGEGFFGAGAVLWEYVCGRVAYALGDGLGSAVG